MTHSLAPGRIIFVFCLVGMLMPLSPGSFGKSPLSVGEAQAGQKAGSHPQSKAAASRPSPGSAARAGNYGLFVQQLRYAPFPYRGKYGETKTDFFDYVDPSSHERFHTNGQGQRLSEREHYSDASTLFYIPSCFKPNKPFSYVVYFHGHGTDVRTFVSDYALDQQVQSSGANVILVVPQLARNAADSSPGKFFVKKAFRTFMREVAEVASRRVGKRYRQRLSDAPIVLAAFSGGYKTVAYILDRGGVGPRIKGVCLFDALYGDVDKYNRWILKSGRRIFFASIFTQGSCEDNSFLLAESLSQHKIPYRTEWSRRASKHEIYFLRSSSNHMQVPIEGPPGEPLMEILRKLKR